MTADHLEEIFSTIHHVGFTPPSRFRKVPGTISLAFHEPFLEDAVDMWKYLLSLSNVPMAITLEQVSAGKLNIVLVIQKKDPQFAFAREVSSDADRFAHFKNRQSGDKGLFMRIHLHADSIEKSMEVDANTVAASGIWIQTCQIKTSPS